MQNSNLTVTNNKPNLPSDITSKSLRDTYYTVQKIISDKYERDLKQAKDNTTARKLTERFNKDIRETINYYVNLC